MKVYIDFEDLDEKTFTNNALIYINRKKGIDYVEQIKIQSLTDYAKQVRKEVCEEIKEKVVYYVASVMCENCGCIQPENYIKHDGLMEILDQIQGETDVKD